MIDILEQGSRLVKQAVNLFDAGKPKLPDSRAALTPKQQQAVVPKPVLAPTPKPVLAPTPKRQLPSTVNNPPTPKDLGWIRAGKAPKFIKRLATGNLAFDALIKRKQVTPAYALAKYYKKLPGGLAGAAERATAYNREHSPSCAPKLDLSPEHLLRPVTEYIISKGYRPDADAFSISSKPVIYRMHEAGNTKSTRLREHELTHQLQTESSTQAPWSGRFQTHYLEQPDELDAYIIGPTKRLYTQATGNPVDTQQQATQAVRWASNLWYDRHGKGKDAWKKIPQQTREDLRSIFSHQFALPPRAMQHYIELRMPGIVHNAPVGTGRHHKMSADLLELGARLVK